MISGVSTIQKKNLSKSQLQQNTNMTEKKPFERKKFMCPVCKFTCDTYQILHDHFIETWHKRVDKQNTRKINKQGVPEYSIPKNQMVFLKDYLNKKDREPLVGLEYVMEYVVQTGESKLEIKYICELCNLQNDLQPMLQHLTGYKHRRAYMSKEFPYVLKGPHVGKEDRHEYMKRMAQEIEQEEGTKMYKIDPASSKIESSSPKDQEKKSSTKKTRWNKDVNIETKKTRALEFLETLDIESESESATVTKLTQKLTTLLKEHEVKAKQETLFANRVAKAKDVAQSIMKSASKKPAKPKGPIPQLMQINPANILPSQNLPLQRPPINQTSLLQAPPLNQNLLSQAPQFHQGPPLIQGPPHIQGQPFSQSPLLQGPQINQNLFLQSSSSQITKRNQKQKRSQPKKELGPEVQGDVTADDDQFFSKLVDLLSDSESTSSDPKMILVQALLKDIVPMTEENPSQENAALNQKKVEAMASQLESSTNSENASLIQELMILMNSSDKVSESLEKPNSKGLGKNLQNYQGVPNALMNQKKDNFNSKVHESKNPSLDRSHIRGDLKGRGRQMDALRSDAYDHFELKREIPKDPFQETPYSSIYPRNREWENPSDPSYSGPSTIPRSVDILPYQDPTYSRMVDSHGIHDMGYEAGDRVPEENYSLNDIAELIRRRKQAEQEMRMRGSGEHDFIMRDVVEDDPFSGDHRRRRDSRSPYMKIEDDPFSTRPSGRYTEDPVWVESSSYERERYGKHARLETDLPSHRSGSESGLYNRSEEQSNLIDINTEGLSADILKRIRGKDLFTVSAILSEYAESRESI